MQMFFSKEKEIHKLIVKHLNSVSECHNVFCECIDQFFIHGFNDQVLLLKDRVEELESEADRDRHDIIKALLKGALLPESRREILKIIELVDEIANNTEEIIKQICLQNIVFLESIKNDILEINAKTKEQFDLLSKTIEALFTSYKEVQAKYEQINNIELMESDIDDLENKAIKTLYSSDIELARKNQLKYFISKISDTSDIIEDISDIIEIILALRKV